MRKNNNPVPRPSHIDPGLIQWLDYHFPERCPDVEWSDRDIWMKVGQRSVIRWLLNHKEEMDDNILKE